MIRTPFSTNGNVSTEFHGRTSTRDYVSRRWPPWSSPDGVSSARIKPYDHGRPASKRSKRMMFIFVVWAGDEVCDLLYNLRTGCAAGIGRARIMVLRRPGT